MDDFSIEFPTTVSFKMLALAAVLLSSFFSLASALPVAHPARLHPRVHQTPVPVPTASATTLPKSNISIGGLSAATTITILSVIIMLAIFVPSLMIFIFLRRRRQSRNSTERQRLIYKVLEDSVSTVEYDSDMESIRSEDNRGVARRDSRRESFESVGPVTPVFTTVLGKPSAEELGEDENGVRKIVERVIGGRGGSRVFLN